MFGRKNGKMSSALTHTTVPDQLFFVITYRCLAFSCPAWLARRFVLFRTFALSSSICCVSRILPGRAQRRDGEQGYTQAGTPAALFMLVARVEATSRPPDVRSAPIGLVKS